MEGLPKKLMDCVNTVELQKIRVEEAEAKLNAEHHAGKVTLSKPDGICFTSPKRILPELNRVVGFELGQTLFSTINPDKSYRYVLMPEQALKLENYAQEKGFSFLSPEIVSELERQQAAHEAQSGMRKR